MSIPPTYSVPQIPDGYYRPPPPPVFDGPDYVPPPYPHEIPQYPKPNPPDYHTSPPPFQPQPEQDYSRKEPKVDRADEIHIPERVYSSSSEEEDQNHDVSPLTNTVRASFKHKFLKTLITIDVLLAILWIVTILTLVFIDKFYVKEN